MRRWLAFLGMLAWAAQPVARADASCKQSPRLVAACYVVHGKMYNANGGSLARIWKIGSHHVLGVVGWEGIDLPPEIGKYMAQFDDVLYGDFLVCPYTKERAGEMQMVCVQSGKHLRPVPVRK